VKAQTKMLHVPYKGSVAAITDLMAGQVQVFFSDAPTAIPQIKAGKVRALAVASAQRTSFFPDLPTIAESGLPGFEAYTWGGFMVPRGTPEAIVQQLSADIGRALADPVIKQKLSDVGAEARPDSPAEFRQLVRSEIAKWGDVVRKTGITAE
jgi:tripartite-type tricarboxylate transporter receptor subunit TctC